MSVSEAVTVRLPAEAVAEIERVAETERRTRSNVVRNALIDWVEARRRAVELREHAA